MVGARDAAAGSWRSFDGAAETYDRVSVPNVFARPAQELLALVPRGPGARVLDLGTGTGAIAVPALGAEPLPSLVVGVDPSSGMLARARANGLRHVLVSRAPALPFADGSFDAVLSGFVLPHVPDPHAVLVEMVRILAPGGSLGVTTWGTFRSDFNGAWLEAASAFVDRDMVTREVDGSIPWADHFTDPRNIEEALRAAGLESITSRRHVFDVTLSVPDFAASRAASLTGRCVRASMDSETWRRCRAHVERELAERLGSSLTYSQDFHAVTGRKP